MKKIIQTGLVSSAVMASSLSYAADAQISTPQLFGNLNIGVSKIENESDLDGQAFEASMGVKGKFSQDTFTLLYKLEAEFTQAVNNDAGQDELEIKNAVAVMPTAYGTFVVAARTESGQQKELYKPVDIFQVNEADANSGLWMQPDEASSVFAYVSPKFNHTHVVGAILTLNSTPGGAVNHNDEDADAWVTRIIHDNDELYLAAGVVRLSEKQVPTDKPYYRSVLSAGYTLNQLNLGMTWENNSDHPAGDSEVLGVVADYAINDRWSVGVGHTNRDADNSALDNAATMLIVRNQIMDNVMLYAEVADYDNTNDNYAIGVNINF